MLYNARLEILDSWRTHVSYHGSSKELLPVAPVVDIWDYARFYFCVLKQKMLPIVWHFCSVFRKRATSFTIFQLDLFAPNAILAVQGPYCSQLLLVPVQCSVSFIIYAGPIWSDKASPSSEAITNNNDDKTQRIFALFCKWLFCVTWRRLLRISRVTWQPFASLLPSHPYQARASGNSFGMGTAPFHHPCWPSMPGGEATVRWIHDHYCESGYLNTVTVSFVCCQNIKRKADANTVSTTNTA